MRGASLVLGLQLLSCSNGADGARHFPRDAGAASQSDPDATVLPGCAEFCASRTAACGTNEASCLIVCSDINRRDKLRCLEEYEALNACFARSAARLCDGGVPDDCVDEVGRVSSCFETDGGDSSGCVQTFGGGTCKGDFVDGRTAQKTCYPGVSIPSGCVSVGEILALRGFPDEGPPATHADGTLVEPTVVCCPP